MLNQTLEFAFPLPRTHCGIALGNGNFGALVWGDERLHITVNRADFWDHRGGEKLLEGTTFEKLKAAYDPADPGRMEAAFVRAERQPGVLASMRLPCGRFEFELAPGARLEKGVLQTGSGTAEIVVRLEEVQAALTVRVCPRRSLLIIDDPARVIRKVKSRPAWEWVGERLSTYCFTPPTIVEEEQLNGWVQDCPEDPSLAALYRQTKQGFTIALERGDDATDAREAASRSIENVLKTGPTTFNSEHDQWWHDYWDRVPQVETPDPFFNDFLHYTLHKFACATNPLSPLPAGLQGPWVEEYQLAPWSGDYHFNVNIQQIYTFASLSSNLEHMLPLFDMLDTGREVLQHNARVLFGIEDGLVLGHALDDRCYQCGGISAGAFLDHGVAGWVAQLYWLYYRYSGDVDFLRNRAYPFMRGVMRVYEQMLEREGDSFTLPIGISPEYAQLLPDGKRQRVGSNPSFQLACIHMLVDALLQASDILNEAPRPIWHDIKEKLAPYTLIGNSNESRIAVWDEQDLEISHRHHSHLAGIYPFDILSDPTPQQQCIIENSIDHWIAVGAGDWSEWSIPWAAILQARMGYTRAPLLWLKLWRDLFVNEGMTTVYIPRLPGITRHRSDWMRQPHPWSTTQSLAEPLHESQEIMQLDGTMAAATAIYEMLVQTRGDTTYIFPAVPDEWQELSFERIRAPGAFLISGVWQRGAMAEATIKSLLGGAIKISVPGITELLIQRTHREEIVSLPAILSMEQDETVYLRPRRKP